MSYCSHHRCKLGFTHEMGAPGCCVHTDVTVFEAKGRRVTTRAKEERGGGRRNASRAVKTCCAGDDPNCRECKPRNSTSPNKSLLECIISYPLPVDPKAFTVDPKAFTAYKLAEVTPEMDLNWSRVQATTKALHDLKEAVHELISAVSGQTTGAYNLRVKGAARKKMIAKEQRRLTAAWIAVDKLNAES